MGWVSDRLEDVGDFVGDVFEGVGDILEGVVDAVGDVLSGIGDFVEGVLENPLPTILQIGGAMIGIPPYVTAAVVTAAQGGDLEDIAKSAIVSYASANVLQATGISDALGDAAFDMTDSISQGFDLPLATAGAIADSVTSAVGQGVVGGMNAVLTGRNVMDGITSGFTSGLIYSGTDSFFAEANKDPNWGLSKTSLDLLKGATSTALNTIASGKGDPSQAVANYVAYATLKMGASELYKTAVRTYEDLTGKTELAQKAQDNYVELKAKYDSELKTYNAEKDKLIGARDAYEDIYENEFKPIENQLNAYKSTFEEQKGIYDAKLKVYEDNKWAYNNYDAKLRQLGYTQTYDDSGVNYYRVVGARVEQRYDGEYGYYNALVPDGSIVDSEGSPTFRYVYDAPSQSTYLNAANAAAKEVNAAGAAAKAASDSYKTLSEDANTVAVVNKLNTQNNVITTSATTMETIRGNIETPANGNLAEQLKNAADKYQREYNNYATSQEAADRAATNYNKIVTEIATRDLTIDAINDGVIKVTGVQDGTYTLSNGMTMKDGKFYQDGQQIYTNAAGVSQNGLEFTDNSGNVVRFGADAGRQLSTTDVQNIFARDFGMNLTEDEAKTFVGGSYTNYDNTKFQDLAIDKITQEFKSIASRAPTQAEANAFLGQDDAITAAQNAAINGLDLPEGYVSPGASQQDKVSFGQAYAAARAAYGPGKTFQWTNDKGETGTFTTDTREEAAFKKAVNQATGDFDTRDVNIVKGRLLDSIRMSNITGNFTDMNPADLSEKEMTKFIDNYVKASPEQRAGLLRGTDSMTYKVINDMLQGYAGVAEKTSGQTYAPPAGFGTIKESDMTNYTGVLDTGLRNAAADIVGLGVRGAQTIANIAGYDTPTLNKIQDLLTESKDERMSKLVGSEKAVAGGLASGLTSAVTWAVGGPVASIVTLGGIAANNAWIEGSNAVIDNQGRTWNSADEARENGVFTYKKLTPEENGLRTAVMASLEIAGEAAGIPGMSKLMKGIPITGDIGKIVNAVKNFGVGLANEQASELLTTTAQMAADKYMSVGLGKNATFEDYKNALIDTAIATTAAVGTAGSIGTATQNLRNTANSTNVFSIDTRESVADPTLPSLVDVYKSYGIQQYDVDQIIKGIQNTIKTGGEGIDSIADRTADTLVNLGVSKSRADNLANEMVDRVLTNTISTNLAGAGLNQDQIDQLVSPIKNDLVNQVGADAFKTNVNTALSDVGIDANTVNLATTQLFGTPVKIDTTTTAPTAVDTTTPAPAGTNAGLTNDQVTTLVNDIAAVNPSLTKEQVTTIVSEAISTLPAGVTPAQVEIAIQNATSNFATKSDIDAALANIQLPAGLTKEDVTAAITSYMQANPGMSAEDVSTAIATYMTNNPGLTKADMDTAITNAVSDFATKSDIETAISNIKFPAGITAADVTSAIETYMAANPGLSAADVTAAIETYMAANPGLTKADMDTAIETAMKGVATTENVGDVATSLETLGSDVQAAFESLTAAQKAEVAARVQQGENLQSAIDTVAKSVTDLTTATNTAVEGISTQISNLNTTVQNAFDNMSIAQKAEVQARVQMGENLETAINTVQENLTKTNTAIQNQITTLSEQTQTQYDQLTANQKAEVAARIQMGENLESAINDVSTTLTEEISGVKEEMAAEKARQIAAQKAAAQAAKSKELLARSQALIAAPTDDTKPDPLTFKDPFMTSESKPGEFKGPLEEFMKTVQTGSYTKPQTITGQPMQQPTQQPVPVPGQPQPTQQSPDQNYFSYGVANEIDSILNPLKGMSTAFTPFEFGAKQGGLATPLMAAGGATGTRYGKYAGGGLNVVNYAGKDRVDYRAGDAVTGPGDGQSDDIPAMLADGEFVIPADVVAALGNGSTKAGSDKLYDMMHSIRAHHRSAKPKDLPPPAKKSPLDYLKDVKRKDRR